MIEDVLQYIDFLVRLARQTQAEIGDERLFRIVQFGVASFPKLTAVQRGCACGDASGVDTVVADDSGAGEHSAGASAHAVESNAEPVAGSDQFGSGQRGCSEQGRRGDADLVVSAATAVGCRGPNYTRNKANREAAKRRKAERKRIGFDWRKRAVVDDHSSEERKGFWNSCSADVRQELIDSKARMHIARNEEEVRKCKAAKAKEESPETLLRNIYRIIELGEQKAKEVNNVKVSNWMGDVAVGCAETMASSAPSSLPSFKELSEKLAASSQSSFDLTLHAKDVEISELQNKLKAQQLRHDSVVEDLNEVIDDLRLSETMAENRFSCLAKPKVKKSVEPKYFTAEQQRNHRQLTTRDMNGPFFH